MTNPSPRWESLSTRRVFREIAEATRDVGPLHRDHVAVLLLGYGIEEPAIVDEFLHCARILSAVSARPDAPMQRVAQHALQARGIPVEFVGEITGVLTATARELSADEWQVQMTGVERRMPLYLLVSASDSMQGPGIAAVNRYLREFAAEVVENSIARDTVVLGLITFGSSAQMVTPGLVPLQEFKPPILAAERVRRLDLAFEVLRESLNRDVRRPVAGSNKGDGRPIVFLLLDGHPTDSEGRPSDNWRGPRDSVVSDQLGGSAPKGTIRLYDIYPMGSGDVDENTLQEISTGLAFKASDNVAFSNFLKLATLTSLLDGSAPSVQSRDVPISLLDDMVVP